MAIKQRSTAKVIGTYLVLCAIAFLMLFPLLWLIGTSFKSPGEYIFTFPPQIFPSQPTFDNFITVWDAYPFGLYLYNSAIVEGQFLIDMTTARTSCLKDTASHIRTRIKAINKMNCFSLQVRHFL